MSETVLAEPPEPRGRWYIGYYRIGWNQAEKLSPQDLEKHIAETRASIERAAFDVFEANGEVKSMSHVEWNKLLEKDGNAACTLACYKAYTDFRAGRAPDVIPGRVSERHLTPV